MFIAGDKLFTGVNTYLRSFAERKYLCRHNCFSAVVTTSEVFSLCKTVKISLSAVLLTPAIAIFPSVVDTIQKKSTA
jgi:hypothetical protein